MVFRLDEVTLTNITRIMLRIFKKESIFVSLMKDKGDRKVQDVNVMHNYLLQKEQLASRKIGERREHFQGLGALILFQELEKR
ncbi:hypothetical protein Lal_00000734 [Lupinus albus]|nr:hypothetical protein Lal_00000734 [Lupinus albus]